MFLLWLRLLPQCGDRTPVSFPSRAEGRSSCTNTPVFLPSPFILPVLCGSIYYFLLFRYSCLCSGGVLHAFLCLKVYFWCSIEREVLHIHLLLCHLVLPPLFLQFSSDAQSFPTLCDPVNRSIPGLPVHHQLPEFTQIHVHWVSDAMQPSHPLSSPFPPSLNLSQHQGLFKLVSSLHQVAKVLEFQL